MTATALLTVRPGDCDPAALDACCRLVLDGGEVIGEGLEERVAAAVALALLCAGDEVVGVAALKRPDREHRLRVFEAAGVSCLARGFDLELGWLAIADGIRDRGFARRLCARALARRGAAGVFATLRGQSSRTIRVVGRLGFVRVGRPWESTRGGRLLLYARCPGF